MDWLSELIVRLLAWLKTNRFQRHRQYMQRAEALNAAHPEAHAGVTGWAEKVRLDASALHRKCPGHSYNDAVVASLIAEVATLKYAMHGSVHPRLLTEARLKEAKKP